MHPFAIPRHRPPQLLNRLLDPVSHPTPFHVAGRQQLVSALGGV